MGATPVSASANAVRRLMHYGQMLQSHALHFFHLSSPDLLFGFDSAVAQRNIVGVAKANPEVAKKGIFLRKFGQEVIRITAGKRIHGTGAVPGGINKLVTAAERDELKRDLPNMLQWAQEAVDITKQLHAQNPALYNSFGSFRSNLMSIVRPDGAMDLYDGVLRVRDANGAILFDGVNDQDYLQLIEEEVRSWSYMKFPHLRSLGRELGWYRVGPLARVQNCDFIPSERAEIERQAFVAWGQGELVHASLAYHWARMIEMLHAVEVIADLLDDPALLSGDLLTGGTRQRSGVGIIEAPRGTLIHDYDVGDDDLVTRCNLIVSTTHNNQAMNEAVRSVARDYLSGHEITEGLLNHIEVAIRAYDPCLSCATHALGQMPLDITLLGADGTVLDRVQKSPGSGLTRSINESM
jgi:NAD-reducing hydrogenase large subunit